MRSVIAAAMVLLIGGCVPQMTYTPPTDEKGQACVQECRVRAMGCSAAAEQQFEVVKREHAEEKAACEEESDKEHYTCLRYARDDYARAMCDSRKKVCIRLGPVRPADNCAQDFNMCFQMCGGKIGVLPY